MLTRSVTDQVTIYLNCSKVWGTFERVSVYHRITSELSAIFAPDPTQEMCEECVSQKGRKEERRISSTCGSRTHNLLLTGLSLCYGRATDGRPRKWALIQRGRVLSAPKQARSWWLSLSYHSLLYLVESCSGFWSTFDLPLSCDIVHVALTWDHSFLLTWLAMEEQALCLETLCWWHLLLTTRTGSLLVPSHRLWSENNLLPFPDIQLRYTNLEWLSKKICQQIVPRIPEFSTAHGRAPTSTILLTCISEVSKGVRPIFM